MNLSSIAGPLSPQTTPVSGDKKPSKLHEAAQQFEALMIGEMMKSVRESGSEGWLGSGGETGDDSALEMAESQFSQALAMNGGLGLSHVIEQRMSQHSSPAQNDSASPEKLSIGSR